MQVPGRVALVTGASSGIGRAVATRLASAGATVVVHGRDPVRTEEVAHLVGGRALCRDLSEPDAARSLARDALAVHGRVDLVVACAGFGWSGPLPEMAAETLEQLIVVDLLAPLQLTRELLPSMLERGSGHVVVVSSVAGRTGVAGEAVYAAAKAGIDAFAESLRLELDGSGVVVSVVVPGAVDTPFFARRGRGYGRALPRQVSAETVARVTLDLIDSGRPEAWVPRWLKVSGIVRGVAPGVFRHLALRYGEPVRAGPPASTRAEP